MRSAVLCEEVKVAGGQKKVQGMPRKEASGGTAKAYLTAYNLTQTIGWTVVFIKVIQYHLTPTIRSTTSLYDYVKFSLSIFQNLAVLEVVHAALRLVPSNPLITAQQISSRVILVCGVLWLAVSPRESFGLPLLLYAWSITEIIRYSTYALNLIASAPRVLLWLRYSTFIILYPIGVTGELLCLYAAQSEVRENKLLSFEMPNILNVIFRYDIFLIVVMSLYIPLFPQLYMHMFKLRRKVLGPQQVPKSGTDKKSK